MSGVCSPVAVRDQRHHGANCWSVVCRALSVSVFLFSLFGFDATTHHLEEHHCTGIRVSGHFAAVLQDCFLFT